MRARTALLAVAVLASGIGVGGPVRASDAPATADAATLARGKAAFTHRCSMCHREGGTGTFILARRLGASRSLLEQRTDLEPTYVRTVVRWGLVNMPRISRVELPETDMDALVAYLTAPKAPARP